MVIQILSASYLQDYKIKFEFSDNTDNTVDFEPFLGTQKTR